MGRMKHGRWIALALGALLVVSCADEDPTTPRRVRDTSNATGQSPGGADGGGSISDGAPSPEPTQNLDASVASLPETPFICTSLRTGSGLQSDPLTGALTETSYSLTLTPEARVAPLYLESQEVRTNLSGLRSAVVAIASLRKSGLIGLTSTWGAVGGAYRVSALDAAPPHPEHPSPELRALERLQQLTYTPPRLTRQIQASGNFVKDVTTRTFTLVDSHGDPKVRPCTARYVYAAPNGGRGSFVIWTDNEDASLFSAGNPKPLNDLATEFQTKIYPTTTCAFGVDPTLQENNAPQTALNRRISMQDDYIHLVFSSRVDGQGSEVLGYFTLTDLLDPDTYPSAYSNQDKVLYISSSAMSRPRADLYATLAHELHHLLFSIHRIQVVTLPRHLAEMQSGKVSWLNEGLSMVSMWINGYGPEGRMPAPSIIEHVAAYLQKPEQYSMTDFFHSGGGNPEDAYGMVTLFMKYVVDRVGDRLLQKFHTFDNSSTMFTGNWTPPSSPPADPDKYLQDAKDHTDPTNLIEQLITREGGSFAAMFTDFGMALAVDGTSNQRVLTQPGVSRFVINGINLASGQYPDSSGNTVTLGGPQASPLTSTLVSLHPFSIAFLAKTDMALQATPLRFTKPTVPDGTGPAIGGRILIRR